MLTTHSLDIKNICEFKHETWISSSIFDTVPFLFMWFHIFFIIFLRAFQPLNHHDFQGTSPWQLPALNQALSHVFFFEAMAASNLKWKYLVGGLLNHPSTGSFSKTSYIKESANPEGSWWLRFNPSEKICSRRIGSWIQVEVKIQKNIWNHHLDSRYIYILDLPLTQDAILATRMTWHFTCFEDCESRPKMNYVNLYLPRLHPAWGVNSRSHRWLHNDNSTIGFEHFQRLLREKKKCMDVSGLLKDQFKLIQSRKTKHRVSAWHCAKMDSSTNSTSKIDSEACFFPSPLRRLKCQVDFPLSQYSPHSCQKIGKYSTEKRGNKEWSEEIQHKSN